MKSWNLKYHGTRKTKRSTRSNVRNGSRLLFRRAGGSGYSGYFWMYSYIRRSDLPSDQCENCKCILHENKLLLFKPLLLLFLIQLKYFFAVFHKKKRIKSLFVIFNFSLMDEICFVFFFLIFFLHPFSVVCPKNVNKIWFQIK